MWERCYQSGESYLGDEIDVEAAANWSGVPGTLTKALLEAGGAGNPGFIDEDPDRPGHYLCHDLFDHAPEYVAGRRRKEQERQKTKVCACCGAIFHSADLRSKFCSDSCKQKSWRDNHSPVSDPALPTVTESSVTSAERYGNVLPKVTDCYPTPAPAPAPIAKEEKTVSAAPKLKRGGHHDLGKYSPEFEEAMAEWRKFMRDIREFEGSFPKEKRFVASGAGSKEAAWLKWIELNRERVNGISITGADLLESVRRWIRVKLLKAQDRVELAAPMLSRMLNKPEFMDAVIDVVRKRSCSQEVQNAV